MLNQYWMFARESESENASSLMRPVTVAYSHQNHEMTRQTNHSDWKNVNTDSPPDTLPLTQEYSENREWVISKVEGCTKIRQVAKTSWMTNNVASEIYSEFIYLCLRLWSPCFSLYFAKGKLLLKAKLIEIKFVYRAMHVYVCIEFKLKIFDGKKSSLFPAFLTT